MTAAAVPAVAAINLCRNSAALTRPTPPTVPKNDTARSPQRLVRLLMLSGDANRPDGRSRVDADDSARMMVRQRKFRVNIYQIRRLGVTALVLISNSYL